MKLKLMTFVKITVVERLRTIILLEGDQKVETKVNGI